MKFINKNTIELEKEINELDNLVFRFINPKKTLKMQNIWKRFSKKTWTFKKLINTKIC